MNDVGDAPAGLLRGLLHTASTVQPHVEAPLPTVGLSPQRLAALTALTELRDAGASLPLAQAADRRCCVKPNVTAGRVRSVPHVVHLCTVHFDEDGLLSGRTASEHARDASDGAGVYVT
jgi:hypothetical protein